MGNKTWDTRYGGPDKGTKQVAPDKGAPDRGAPDREHQISASHRLEGHKTWVTRHGGPDKGATVRGAQDMGNKTWGARQRRNR